MRSAAMIWDWDSLMELMRRRDWRLSWPIWVIASSRRVKGIMLKSPAMSAMTAMQMKLRNSFPLMLAVIFARNSMSFLSGAGGAVCRELWRSGGSVFL